MAPTATVDSTSGAVYNLSMDTTTAVRDAGHGLLQAIIASPDDDSLRLICADWLDEHGQPERAEFIRVQCELGGPCRDCKPHHAKQGCCAKRAALRRQERKFLERYKWQWTGFPVAFATALDETAWTWRRGFVEAISITTAAFLQHVESLFRAAPLIQVRLGDKKPLPGAGPKPKFYWLPGHRDNCGADHLPLAIFNRLTGELFSIAGAKRYENEAAAMTDLSNQCVHHGRDLLRLPTLDLHTRASP